MTVTLPDFVTVLGSLTPLQLGTFTVLLAAADVGWNVIQSLAKGSLDLSLLPQFLESHVLVRIFPILVLAFLGAGTLGIPAIPALFALAVLGAAGYAAETVGSLIVAAAQQAYRAAIVKTAATTDAAPTPEPIPPPAVPEPDPLPGG